MIDRQTLAVVARQGEHGEAIAACGSQAHERALDGEEIGVAVVGRFVDLPAGRGIDAHGEAGGPVAVAIGCFEAQTVEVIAVQAIVQGVFAGGAAVDLGGVEPIRIAGFFKDVKRCRWAATPKQAHRTLRIGRIGGEQRRRQLVRQAGRERAVGADVGWRRNRRRGRGRRIVVARNALPRTMHSVGYAKQSGFFQPVGGMQPA